MEMFEPPAPVERLMDILHDEHRALLAGEFAVLQSIARKKEKAFAALKAADNADALAQLKGMCARNQSLLKAAAHGIRAATTALAANIAPQDRFDTYDQAGQKIGPPAKPVTLTRRA